MFLYAQLIALFGLQQIISPVINNIFQFDSENNLVSVQAVTTENLPKISDYKSLGVVLNSPRAIIVDVATGQPLWKKSDTEVQSIASITKLMTALVFLENNPGWDKEVEVNIDDYREGGRRYIFHGEKILVKDLFDLALVASSNEAVIALVRSTGVSEVDFVTKMNEHAKELGMSNTQFSEPTGLDVKNRSTASDLAKLIIKASEKREIAEATTKEKAEIQLINSGGKKKVVIPATDRLLGSFVNIVTGKTGFVEEAGYCMAAVVTNEQGKRLAIVTLGADSSVDRFQDVKSLVWWAFKQFIWS